MVLIADLFIGPHVLMEVKPKLLYCIIRDSGELGEVGLNKAGLMSSQTFKNQNVFLSTEEYDTLLSFSLFFFSKSFLSLIKKLKFQI